MNLAYRRCPLHVRHIRYACIGCLILSLPDDVLVVGVYAWYYVVGPRFAVSILAQTIGWLSLQSLICIHYALSLFSAQYIYSCIDFPHRCDTMRCYYKLYDCILVWQVAARMSRNSYEYMSMPPQKINNCLKNGGDAATKFLHFSTCLVDTI